MQCAVCLIQANRIAGGKITGEQLMLIYSSIIAFYFGTQSQKNQDAIDKGA